MVVMLLANIINAAANYVLIYGTYGWPEMGAAGAAIATSFTRWFMFFAMLIYMAIAIDKKHYGFLGAPSNFFQNGKIFRHIGYPMALGQGLESSSFSAMAIIAGWMGAVAVGAWAISMNVLAIVFMFSLGFTTAASVRVGNAVGKRDPANLARAGWVGVALCAVALLVIGAGIYMARYSIATIYTDDGDVLLITAATLVIAVFVLVPDGLQAVLVGALRGASDFWPPAITQLLAFWLVMVPLAYLYGYRMDAGAEGLMQCVGVGALVAAIILLVRFHLLTVRFRRHSSPVF
jgi:MATE family multidrug resistance protein